MRIGSSIGIALGAALIAAAPAKAADREANPDPWEPLNRSSFAITSRLDRVLLRPLAISYKRITPKPIRVGLRNALSNLGEPVVALNDLLQGRPVTAGGTIVRFTTNSTIGVLGLFDPAGALNLPHHDNGFGLTLGRYGAEAGPYIFLPILGPTTVRDGVGRVVDTASSPLTYAKFRGDDALKVSRVVVGALDARAEGDEALEGLKAGATDDYATLRSVYLQSRQAEIRGDKQDEILPEFSDPVADTPAIPDTPTPPAPPKA